MRTYLNWEVAHLSPYHRIHKAPVHLDGKPIGWFVITENYRMDMGVFNDTRPYVITQFEHKKSKFQGSEVTNYIASFYNTLHAPDAFVSLAKSICETHMMGIQCGDVDVCSESGSLLMRYIDFQ